MLSDRGAFVIIRHFSKLLSFGGISRYSDIVFPLVKRGHLSRTPFLSQIVPNCDPFHRGGGLFYKGIQNEGERWDGSLDPPLSSEIIRRAFQLVFHSSFFLGEILDNHLWLYYATIWDYLRLSYLRLSWSTILDNPSQLSHTIKDYLRLYETFIPDFLRQLSKTIY